MRTYCSFADAIRHIEEVPQTPHGRNGDNQTMTLSHHHPGCVNREEIVSPARQMKTESQIMIVSQCQ